jgi:hypothetical protein
MKHGADERVGLRQRFPREVSLADGSNSCANEKGQRMIKQLLTRRIASDTAVARFGQAVCFGAACLMPVLACRKFATLELSEAELLIGVLATMSMALLCTVFGVLLESKAKAV